MGRKVIDLTGRKFGKLMIIKRSYPNQRNGHLMWLCKCECGIEKIVSGWHLKNGHTKSCGCLWKGKKKFHFDLASMRALMRNYKASAKKRGYSFELTEEQFAEITKQDCYYCGIKPNGIVKYKEINTEYIYNGIDRVDNDKGYTVENTVPCCKHCNIAKNNMTLQEFKDWIRRISNRILSI